MGGLATNRWRVGFAVALLAGAALGLSGKAGAAGTLRFAASATADAGRLQFSVPGASLSDQIIDGGGPVAQADLDSLGANRAFASQPYPGELGVIAPGLVASLAGAPQPPAYPFIAASRHPGDSEQTVEPTPGYRLAAKSDATSSEATAATGGAQGENKVFASRAHARVAKAEDLVSAEATNRFEGITLGPLSIASIVSVASVSRAPNGEPERNSSLLVHGVTVNGQPVGVSDKGFVTGENATPLPPSDPLLSAVEQDGLFVTYLKAQPTSGGVVAPGLRITAVRAIPGAGHTATISLTLGRASASVESSTESIGLPSEEAVGAPEAAQAVSPVPADGPPATPADRPSPSAGPANVAAAPGERPLARRAALARNVIAPAPEADTALVETLPEVTAIPEAAPAPAPKVAGAEEVVAAPAQLASRLALNSEKAELSFYPLLVLGGVILFGGLHVARLIGGAR
jgi:hypothetical protein